MKQLFINNDKKCKNCTDSLTGTRKVCLACQRGLVDLIKNRDTGETWECHCSVYKCECVDKQFFCSVCDNYFQESKYLAEHIEDEKVRYVANMVTHMRHTHIKSWNRMWDKGAGGGYQTAAHFGDYDDEKEKVNERQKRNLIRKSKDFLKAHGINSAHFLQLQENDEKTIALAKKVLDS